MLIKGRIKRIDLIGQDGSKVGEIEELTSELGIAEEGIAKEVISVLGLRKASLARVRLEGPDAIHLHKKRSEFYICESGEGELFGGDVFFPLKKLKEGDVVLIPPGTLHAARPKKRGAMLTFLCLSIPAFNLTDVYYPTDRNFDWWADYEPAQ